MIQEADALAEVVFQSRGLQARGQILMVYAIEGLGRIQIDQHALIVVFYTLLDGADLLQLDLNCSSLYSTSLLGSQQNLAD